MKYSVAISNVHSNPHKVSLTNRIGQVAEFNVCEREHEGRRYVFIESLEQTVSQVTHKNANYFAVQLAQRLTIDPRQLHIIELRSQEGEAEVWRWRLKLADGAIVDTIPEPIPPSNYQTFLLGLRG